MYNTMVLKVDFLVGTDIEQAIKESIQLCKTLKLGLVEFNFNGVRMYINECSILHLEVEDYKRRLKALQG